MDENPYLSPTATPTESPRNRPWPRRRFWVVFAVLGPIYAVLGGIVLGIPLTVLGYEWDLLRSPQQPLDVTFIVLGMLAGTSFAALAARHLSRRE